MITRFRTAEDQRTLFELRAKLRLAEGEVAELRRQLDQAQNRVYFYQSVIDMMTRPQKETDQ